MCGKAASVTGFSISLGQFCSVCLNETNTYYTDSFVFNLLLPVLPSFLTFISAGLMWTSMKYESPIYLWISKKRSMAMQTMKALAGEVLSVLKPDEEEEEEDTDKSAVVKYSYKEIFCNPCLRRILGQVCITAFLQQATGFSSVTVYSSYYWKKHLDFPYAGSMILALASAAILFTYLYIDSNS